LFAQILKEDRNRDRLDKFKRDVSRLKAPCFVSDSVVQEADSKIEEIGNFLSKSLKEIMLYHFEEERRKIGVGASAPITSSDVQILERMFIDIHEQEYARQFAAHYRALEIWILNFLENAIGNGKPIDPLGLVTELVSWALQYIASISDAFDRDIRVRAEFAKPIAAAADQSIINDLMDITIEPSDARHISAAAGQVPSTFEKVVFVTLDYHTIIRFQAEIVRVAGVVCTDPLYAAFHLQGLG
jgi:hypothetical protein